MITHYQPPAAQATAEQMCAIKHEFMAFRNGIVADTLRSAGMTCYSVIFGLTLPQLGEIARRFPQEPMLAQALWNDRKVRESRLLATYLWPHEECSKEQALAMMADVQTREEADLLCFRLLRRLPFAAELLSAQTDSTKYVCEALARNLQG